MDDASTATRWFAFAIDGEARVRLAGGSVGSARFARGGSDVGRSDVGTRVGTRGVGSSA